MNRVRIIAGSRLHTGFHTIGNYQYGIHYAGAGFYSSNPRIVLEASECEENEIIADDEKAEIIKQVLRIMGTTACIRLAESPPLHYGFGVTTQLSMATYHALKLLRGENPSREELLTSGIYKLGRSKASLVGAILYAYGGFTFSPGVPPSKKLNPITLKVPSEWRFLIVIPELPQGLHGSKEDKILWRPTTPEPTIRSMMSKGAHMLILGIMRENLELTIEGLRLLQVSTGRYFSRIQGGVYRRDIAMLVDEAQRDGIFLAQSSWGPSLYTITSSDAVHSDAKTLRLIGGLLGLKLTVVIGKPLNRGAITEKD